MFTTKSTKQAEKQLAFLCLLRALRGEFKDPRANSYCIFGVKRVKYGKFFFDVMFGE